LNLDAFRYATSKCRSVEDLKSLKHYGYRGEVLASIIESSEYVEITTMTERFKGTYKKRFSNGKHNRKLESGPDFRKKNSGFIIEVKKLMSNMPVRRIRGPKSIEQQEIKKVLQRICLINPAIIIECRNQCEYACILRFKGTISFSEAFSSLFDKKFSLIEECHLYENYFFNAFVAKEFHNSKNYQFVYVNKRFVGRGKLHRELNERFQKIVPKKTSSTTKYPVFLVNIKCSLNLYDITLDHRKSDVEFRDFDALSKGLDGLLLLFQSAFISMAQSGLNMTSEMSNSNSKNEKSKKVITSGKRAKLNESLNTSKIGLNVTTHDVKGAVHSRFATRSDNTVDFVENDLFNKNSSQLSSLQPSRQYTDEECDKLIEGIEKRIKAREENLKASQESFQDGKPDNTKSRSAGQGSNPEKLFGKVRPGITKNVFKQFPYWQKVNETPSSDSPSPKSSVSDSASLELFKARCEERDIKYLEMYKAKAEAQDKYERERRLKEQQQATKSSTNLELNDTDFNWKIERFLRDSETYGGMNSEFKYSGVYTDLSSLPSVPDQDKINRSLSFVESPLYNPPKKMMKTDEESVKAIKTLYLSQSPIGSPETNKKDNLNDSVEIIEISGKETVPTTSAETFYMNETLRMCELLDGNILQSTYCEFYKKPLADSLAEMNKTESGKILYNRLKMTVRDDNKLSENPNDEFRVRAPDVEVEDTDVDMLEV